MTQANGLSLETEQLTAHLMLLGWWPCTWKMNYGRRMGVCNDKQVVWVRYDKAYIGPIEPQWIFKDIEWWQLTDDAIKKMAYTLDNTLMGW